MVGQKREDMGNIRLIIDSAIQQLQKAIDLTVKLQSLVQLGNHFSESQKESARGLSEEVLQSCRAAVSLLMSGGSGSTDNVDLERELKVEFGLPSSSSISTIAGQDPQALLVGTDEEGDHLATDYSRETITETPYVDGYEWRKYGEKKINGFCFTRSYYRCTYSKDRRCKAKKQVQQQNHGFPSLYLVTYRGEHTCRDEDDEQQVQLRSFSNCINPLNSEGRYISNAPASWHPPQQSKAWFEIGSSAGDHLLSPTSSAKEDNAQSN